MAARSKNRANAEKEEMEDKAEKEKKYLVTKEKKWYVCNNRYRYLNLYGHMGMQYGVQNNNRICTGY